MEQACDRDDHDRGACWAMESGNVALRRVLSISCYSWHMSCYYRNDKVFNEEIKLNLRFD